MSSVPWGTETERADYYNAEYNNLLAVFSNLEKEVERLKKLLSESEERTATCAKASYKEGIRDFATVIEEMAEKERLVAIDGKWAISQAMIDKAKRMLIGEER